MQLLASEYCTLKTNSKTDYKANLFEGFLLLRDHCVAFLNILPRNSSIQHNTICYTDKHKYINDGSVRNDC